MNIHFIRCLSYFTRILISNTSFDFEQGMEVLQLKHKFKYCSCFYGEYSISDVREVTAENFSYIYHISKYPTIIWFFLLNHHDDSKHQCSRNQQFNRLWWVNSDGICDMREVTAENFSPILTNRWWSARPLQEAAKEDPGNGMLLLLYFLNAKPMMNWHLYTTSKEIIFVRFFADLLLKTWALTYYQFYVWQTDPILI